MRCPKCGYISYDHIDSCLKCKKDISGEVEVAGTTYHAVAPSFLRVPKKDDVKTASPVQDVEDDDYEFVDSDLAVLNDDDEIGFADDEDSEISMDEGSIDFQLEDDEEDAGGGFDFDLDEDESTAPSVAEQPSLSVPDELADISDLAPPVRERVSPADSGNGMNLSLDDELNLDESLDLDGLDLNLGLGGAEEAEADIQTLSLDDIDLSGADDDDLGGFDLDLDLGESPAKEKEKPSSSLDGLSLSLD